MLYLYGEVYNNAFWCDSIMSGGDIITHTRYFRYILILIFNNEIRIRRKLCMSMRTRNWQVLSGAVALAFGRI